MSYGQKAANHLSLAFFVPVDHTQAIWPTGRGLRIGSGQVIENLCGCFDHGAQMVFRRVQHAFTEIASLSGRLFVVTYHSLNKRGGGIHNQSTPHRAFPDGFPRGFLLPRRGAFAIAT
jgi:hypothetical protein